MKGAAGASLYGSRAASGVVLAVATFAFLGAYFFAINLILRRYARDDLRPKAYSTITVRVIVAVLLGWLVEVVAPDGWPQAPLLVAALGHVEVVDVEGGEDVSLVGQHPALVLGLALVGDNAGHVINRPTLPSAVQ